jgi:hypothetical protein
VNYDFLKEPLPDWNEKLFPGSRAALALIRTEVHEANAKAAALAKAGVPVTPESVTFASMHPEFGGTFWERLIAYNLLHMTRRQRIVLRLRAAWIKFRKPRRSPWDLTGL